MKRRVIPAAAVALLLHGCALFPYEYADPLPSPSPSPSPSPIVLPSHAPAANMFGIAFSPAGNFQPLTDTLRYNDQAARLCYEGLFEIDRDFTPQPLLCISMEAEGELSYIFTLRDGVTFHDGSPLTAADVVYSIELARKPGGPYSERLARVSGVSARAGETVLVTVSEPVWNAAALFDFPVVKESPGAVAPGTGPYYADLDEDCLLPYAGWWRDKPLPAGRIGLVAADSADTLVYSFQYGYIAMMPADPWDTFAPGVSSGYEKVSVPSGLVQYIGFNTQKAPLDRSEIRQALALALDRREAVAAVYGADARAAVLPVPPSSPFYLQQSAMRYHFDPGGAARLNGGVGELDFIVGAGNAARVEMARLCSEQFREAGFNVDLRILDWGAFNEALSDGDFDLYYAEARPSPNFDPRAFLLEGGRFFFGGQEGEAVREACGALTDGGGLEAVWDALFEELPMLTVCFRNTAFLSQRGLLREQTPTFYNAYYHWEDWIVNEG